MPDDHSIALTLGGGAARTLALGDAAVRAAPGHRGGRCRSMGVNTVAAVSIPVSFQGASINVPVLGDFSSFCLGFHPANDSGDEIADVNQPVVAPIASASVSSVPCHVQSMTKEDSGVSEKSSEQKEFHSPLKGGSMSFTAEAVRLEMSDRVQDVVRRSPGETVKARLNAAARVLGLSVGRVGDFFYGEVRRVEAHEAEQIRANHEVAKQQQLARAEAEYRRLQAEVVREAPRGLGWLCPPALAETEE